MTDARARRLCQARIERGLDSAAEAARALGVSYSTYAAHENGWRDFTAQAPRYARFFKVQLEWLMNGSGPMRAGHKAPVQEYYDDLPEDRRAEALRFMEFLKNRP